MQSLVDATDWRHEYGNEVERKVAEITHRLCWRLPYSWWRAEEMPDDTIRLIGGRSGACVFLHPDAPDALLSRLLGVITTRERQLRHQKEAAYA